MTKTLRLPTTISPVDGEHVLNRWIAGRTQGSMRHVGGRLYLTTHRLIFVPHFIEIYLNGARKVILLNEIVGVGELPRDFSQPLAASLGKRVWVELSDRSVERYRLNDIDRAITGIRRAANLT